MVPAGDVEPSVSEWWLLSIVGVEFPMPKSVLQFQSEGWLRTAAAGAAQPEVPEGLNRWRQILMNLSCFLSIKLLKTKQKWHLVKEQYLHY